MLIEKTNGNYAACRIPGLVITHKNTLLGYYECRDSLSDWARIDLKIIRSTDKGNTWEPVTILSGNGNTLNNPVMVVKGDVIHFLFMKNYKKLFYCRSFDDGKTFSEPKEIKGVFESGNFFYNAAAIGPGHSIVHDGSIVVPVWFAYNHTYPKAHRPSFISTIYSLDDGETWHLGEIIGKDFLINPSECALAVTADGKILNSIRNHNEPINRCLAISKTGYSDWENIYSEPNLPDPVCQGSMFHKDGIIFHINCNSRTEREALTLKISNDYFKTYKEILIDTQGGYSDIAVSEDEIFVLYERNIDTDGIYFKKIKYKKSLVGDTS